jgi:hypothetical protein
VSDQYGTPVAFRVSAEERAGLKARAARHGRSVSDELRAIVARALDPAHEFDLAPVLVGVPHPLDTATAPPPGASFPGRVVPRSRARARRTDPTTSHEAAASVTDLTAKQAAVLDVLGAIGPATDEALVREYERRRRFAIDLAPSWGRGYRPPPEDILPEQSASGIRTRRSELVDAGRVRAVDHEGRTASGRRSTRWAVVA